MEWNPYDVAISVLFIVGSVITVIQFGLILVLFNSADRIDTQLQKADRHIDVLFERNCRFTGQIDEIRDAIDQVSNRNGATNQVIKLGPLELSDKEDAEIRRAISQNRDLLTTDG